MPTQNRRADEAHDTNVTQATGDTGDTGDPGDTGKRCSFDLAELSALYGEAGLSTLLAVALDEFDCQRLAFDNAFQCAKWAPAAHALHRLAGTAAFFVREERMLEPLNRAERALRLADAPLIGHTIPAARSALVVLRAAFAHELAHTKKTR